MFRNTGYFPKIFNDLNLAPKNGQIIKYFFYKTLNKKHTIHTLHTIHRHFVTKLEKRIKMQEAPFG